MCSLERKTYLLRTLTRKAASKQLALEKAEKIFLPDVHRGVGLIKQEKLIGWIEKGDFYWKFLMADGLFIITIESNVSAKKKKKKRKKENNMPQ
jgi:hypothetical protein